MVKICACKKKRLLTLFNATMKGVLRSRSSRSDSNVWGSSPCCATNEIKSSRKPTLTMISTTRTAMLQRELPRDRKLVKDSWPGVSMTNNPGILYSCELSCRTADQYRPRKNSSYNTYLIHDASLSLNSIYREICCTDLLRDTSRFSFLYICLTDLHANVKI